MRELNDALVGPKMKWLTTLNTSGSAAYIGTSEFFLSHGSFRNDGNALDGSSTHNAVQDKSSQ